MFRQLDLLTYQSDLQAEAYDYFNELQSVTFARRNEAGYAGDLRGEARVKAIYDEGARLYRERREERLTHEKFLEQIKELIVQTYCLVIKGSVFRDIYFIPAQPVTYRPRFARDLRAKLPQGVLLPEDAFLVFTQQRENGDSYSVLYIQGDRWHMAHFWCLKDNGKWDSRVRRIYGETFRADELGQWWSREGFRIAKEEKRLDPQIAGAVFQNFWKFYGRDEALRRLDFPPLSTLPDRMKWRDYFDGVVQGKKG